MMAVLPTDSNGFEQQYEKTLFEKFGCQQIGLQTVPVRVEYKQFYNCLFLNHYLKLTKRNT